MSLFFMDAFRPLIFSQHSCMHSTFPEFFKLPKYLKLSYEKYAFPSLEMSTLGYFL